MLSSKKSLMKLYNRLLIGWENNDVPVVLINHHLMIKMVTAIRHGMNNMAIDHHQKNKYLHRRIINNSCVYRQI